MKTIKNITIIPTKKYNRLDVVTAPIARINISDKHTELMIC